MQFDLFVRHALTSAAYDGLLFWPSPVKPFVHPLADFGHRSLDEWLKTMVKVNRPTKET